MNIIIPNLKNYMLELLSKYLYYELQCEEVWLQISVDYMIKVEDVLEFVRSYYKGSIRKNVDMQMADFKKTCVEFVSTLNNKSADIENRYRALHKKLKPLHGHPNNKAMLLCLENDLLQLNEVVVDIQEEITESCDNFKEKIDENLKTFENEMWITEGQLKDNLDHYISLIVDDESLLQQIKNRIEYMGTFISSDYYSCSSSEKYFNIIIELNNKLNELKQGLHITSHSLMKFSDSIMKVLKYADDLSSNVSSDIPTTSNSCSYVNIVELIELYREQQETCKTKVNFSKNLADISNKWNERWKSDVEKIKNLYTVKYNQAQLLLEKNK